VLAVPGVHCYPVDPFRALGMPRIPGFSELLELMQKQTEVLGELPRTITNLQGAIHDLTEATTKARKVVDSAQRVTESLENLVEELAPTVLAVRPGLERVGRVLDDPAIDTVPETLARIHDDLVPLIHGLRRAQSRVASLTRRIRRRQSRSPGHHDEDVDDQAPA
jgi:ABC-type transporter Mla subunit MlaD